MWMQAYFLGRETRPGRCLPCGLHADQSNAPHGPLNIEPKYVKPYVNCTPHEDRARFYGMITNIDENIGHMIQHLNTLNIAEDTIIIFMTDNGTANGVELDEKEFPKEGQGSYNSGMRGKKGSPYEGGHRVPFFLYCRGFGFYVDCADTHSRSILSHYDTPGDHAADLQDGLTALPHQTHSF